MGLEALLATLERREAATPVTPRYPSGVTARAAPDKACTPVTPVTPESDEAGTSVAGARIEPIGEQSRQEATPRESAELRAMIGAVLANDSDDDRAEALVVALADPVAALVCFRALAQDRRACAAPEPIGDTRMRSCRECANLTTTGRCLAAWRRESLGTGIAVSRNYSPAMPDATQRCGAYAPGPDDPDRRSGRERWPFLFREAIK